MGGIYIADRYAFERKCPVCGKLFYVADYANWVFKRRTGKSGVTALCSWSCCREWDKKKTEGKRRRAEAGS